MYILQNGIAQKELCVKSAGILKQSPTDCYDMASYCQQGLQCTTGLFGTDGTGKCIANPMATSPDGCQLISYTQSLGESCDMVSYCETGLKCTNGVFGTGKCAKGESPVPKMPARTLAQASLIVSRVSASLRLGLPVESFESRVELAFICLRSFRNSIKSGWSYYKHYPLPTEDQHKTGDD